MRNLFSVLMIILVSLSLVVCSDFSGWDVIGGGSYAPAVPSGVPGGDYVSGGMNGNQNRPGSGQLTCGEWSDIKNYPFYLSLFNIIDDTDPDIDDSQRRMGFRSFIDYFGFETRYMVTVNVIHNEAPVCDAAVELYDSTDDLLFKAKTDVLGNAYLFPYYNLNGENITVKVISGGFETSQSLVYAQEDGLQIDLDSRDIAQSVLDIMFVIDTTGSMGDELSYLKEEISDVIGEISSLNPGYTINLALLFYRDTGDQYVTRSFNFTSDISQQRQNLSRQHAEGGGDFPEAADRALSEAMQLSWTETSAVRLLFHVCDAPPHEEQENKTLFFNSVNAAAQKGIRIIPVASSGIDLKTEYLLRQEALMTGGTYIFLTDDSGIGNDHLLATVGDYTVEYLNACLKRIINEYLTGEETEPVPYYFP
ncbi:MAG: VWA domain-containing protein [Treponema sp.]|jgi:hypothetical protein|nr:VWA domain-containing protein [Treponema sp.]